MVKPAMPYLDVLADARLIAPNHPLACYQVSFMRLTCALRANRLIEFGQVSGEYAMVVAGARAGVYDLRQMAFETTEGMLRAGEAHSGLSIFLPRH